MSICNDERKYLTAYCYGLGALLFVNTLADYWLLAKHKIIVTMNKNYYSLFLLLFKSFYLLLEIQNFIVANQPVK